MANKGYKDLALCPRGVEPEEDGQDDQDAIGADRCTVPSESVLMRSDAKPVDVDVDKQWEILK